MCSRTEKTEKSSRLQKAINTVVGIICVIALILVCSEPAPGTSFNSWLGWELFWLAVFAGSAAYLNKHIPDDKDKV